MTFQECFWRFVIRVFFGLASKFHGLGKNIKRNWWIESWTVPSSTPCFPEFCFLKLSKCVSAPTWIKKQSALCLSSGSKPVWTGRVWTSAEWNPTACEGRWCSWRRQVSIGSDVERHSSLQFALNIYGCVLLLCRVLNFLSFSSMSGMPCSITSSAVFGITFMWYCAWVLWEMHFVLAAVCSLLWLIVVLLTGLPSGQGQSTPTKLNSFPRDHTLSALLYI